MLNRLRSMTIRDWVFSAFKFLLACVTATALLVAVTFVVSMVIPVVVVILMFGLPSLGALIILYTLYRAIFVVNLKEIDHDNHA